MSVRRPARITTLRTLALLAGSLGVTAIASCGGSSGGGSISASTGADIFKAANCSSCHTMAAASATGVIGPNLDQLAPDAATVTRYVTSGEGRMPSFKDRLTAAQIETLSQYVAESTAK